MQLLDSKKSWDQTSENVEKSFWEIPVARTVSVLLWFRKIADKSLMLHTGFFHQIAVNLQIDGKISWSNLGLISISSNTLHNVINREQMF